MSSQDVSIQVQWRTVPTLFVDQVVGFAAADGVGRLTLGELAFNPDGGRPIGRPVVTIAASLLGLERLAFQLKEVIEQMKAE